MMICEDTFACVIIISLLNTNTADPCCPLQRYALFSKRFKKRSDGVNGRHIHVDKAQGNGNVGANIGVAVWNRINAYCVTGLYAILGRLMINHMLNMNSLQQVLCYRKENPFMRHQWLQLIKQSKEKIMIDLHQKTSHAKSCAQEIECANASNN